MSTAQSHDPAFGHKGRTVGYVHRAIRTNRHATGEGERPAGQKRVSTGTVKRDLHHVALRIFAVNPIRVSKQLRRIEVAVTPEVATVDRPQPGSPLGHRCVPWLRDISVRRVE